MKHVKLFEHFLNESDLKRTSFNIGDKVLFDNKKAVVLWTSVSYLDIEIIDTNRILQGVHISKVEKW